MKPSAEMHEGPEAFMRFRAAVKHILSVPKGAVPNPFGTRKKKSAKAMRKIGPKK
jgi:hypothetical protein